MTYFISGVFDRALWAPAERAGGGRPPRGLGGGARTAVAAVGPGGGGGEAPKDYTKPQQTTQSFKNIIQRHKRLYRNMKY